MREQGGICPRFHRFLLKSQEFCQESLGGWSPSWIGKPGKGGQVIIDAIGRKNELIYNLTRDIFPDPSKTTIMYFDFAAASWLPTGSTDGCYNPAGNGVTACSTHSGDTYLIRPTTHCVSIL